MAVSDQAVEAVLAVEIAEAGLEVSEIVALEDLDATMMAVHQVDLIVVMTLALGALVDSGAETVSEDQEVAAAVTAADLLKAKVVQDASKSLPLIRKRTPTD